MPNGARPGEPRVGGAGVAEQDPLLRRDALLAGVAEATEALLVVPDPDAAIARALEAVGRGAGVDRVTIFEIQRTGDGVVTASHRHEWLRDGCGVRLLKADLQDLVMDETFAGWYDALHAGHSAGGIVSAMRGPSRRFFDSANTRSILALPIQIDGALWGFINFHDYAREVEWTAADRAVLRTVAVNFAGFERRLDAERRLAEANRELVAANAAKTAFLAAMSHELRTPLHAVLGMADLLATALQRGEHDAGEQRDAVEAIRSGGGQLLRLVDAVLDMAALESGTLGLASAAFDVPAWLEEAVGPYRHVAASKGLHFVARVAPGPAALFGDRRRLAQVLGNLVDNAIKFTPAGSVRVDVETRRLPGRCAHELAVAVNDTGVGLGQGPVDALFAPFEQGDGSRTRRYGGTGLGLALSRRILGLMGGQLTAEDVGSGARFAFSVWLPCAEEPCSACEPGSVALEAPVAAPTTGLRVLVAEDNRVNQRIVKRTLEAKGHVVEIAADGFEAVAKAQAGAWDLVLMDVDMPGLDGIEASRRIRTLPSVTARIVALTAQAGAGDRTACFAAGMDDYIGKPLVAAELDRVLADAARQRARRVIALS